MAIAEWDGSRWRVAHPDVAIARVAGAQYGAISTRQLEACGLGRRGVASRVRSGRLHRRHRGVYLVGHAVPPALAREASALLAVGPGGALSHRTAAELLRLLPRDGDGPVHVSVAAGHPRPRAGLAVHRVREISRIRVHGLDVTTAERTLRDLEAPLVERARAEAERRGLVRPAGEARLTRSEAERRLLAVLRRAGIPPDATNARVGRFEVDMLFRAARVVVEIDGFAYHAHRHAFERDRVRDAELQARGYRVLRVT